MKTRLTDLMLLLLLLYTVVYLVVIESYDDYLLHITSTGMVTSSGVCSNMGSGHTGRHGHMAGKVVIDTKERRFVQQRQPQRIQKKQSRYRFWTVGLTKVLSVFTLGSKI